ncbi:Ger(x)C family spore germination protein [Gracilibacillus oryzae]|uniref:Ger(X)C family spore germination protein n=1 Tax=Gracilibacillus oryzae TaxID=1672701 RepID=A0A7C8GT20_9BACI|nr:Ger(x)C family spore germination protein [Gracilibacillus oryzae]KAB8131765.1 Ger(x)C family spore germination protein [Gracilibacillus oryzae]
MKVNKILLTFICTIMLLTGCVRTTVIDDIELIMLYGFDWDPIKEQYIGTAVSPLYGFSEQTSVRENTYYTSRSKTVQGINAKTQNKAPFQVETGKLTSIMFGEELAEKGIKKILQGINEIPDIGRNLYPVIVKGKAEDLLAKKYELQQTFPHYIKSLMESNMKRNLPNMNLHLFNYQNSGDGMDPFMPIVSTSTAAADVIGLGFFSKDKLVHEIGPDQFFTFKSMFENITDGTYQFEWRKKNQSIDVISIRSSHKKEWVSKDKLNIIITIDGFLAETVSVSVDNTREKEELEKEIGKDLEKDAVRLIKEFQETEIDPLMIGASARSKFRDWNKDEWQQRYPAVEITPIVKFHIKQINISQ